MNSQQIIDKIEFYENQVDLKHQKNHMKDFFINGNMNFSMKQQTNTVLTFLQFILISMTAIHIVITEYLISSQQENSITALIDFFQGQSTFYRIIQVAIIILKAFLILSVYMQIKEKPYIVGITWVNQKMFKYYRLLKEVDLCFSALLCIINQSQNLALFSISCIIYMFHALYLQNYVVRKDCTYATSFSNYIGFRFFILLNYIVNIISLGIQNGILFAYFYSISFFVMLLWFVRYGYNLFHHEIVRKIHLTVVSLFLTIYFNFFLNLALNLQSSSRFLSISKLIIIFAVLTFFLRMIKNKFDHHSISLNQASVKSMDLSLSKMLQLSVMNADLEVQLIGLLCFKDKDIENRSELKFYDPILRAQIQGKDLYIQKQSTLKRYIKTIYEDIIQSQIISDGDIYIDYCEFLCNYNANFFEISRYMAMAKACPLNIQQRIKIDRMQCLIREWNEKLNVLVYDGHLQIQQIIKSEECFSTLEAKIKLYIDGYIKVWCHFKQQEISLLELRLHLKRLFSIMQQINMRWKNIMKFFNVNKKWNFIYIHYLHFIKNQKIKQKQTDIFRQINLQGQNAFDNQPIFFTGSSKQNDLYNPLMLFHEDTCFIQAQYLLGNLIIKDANKRFQTIFGLKKKQIFNCSVQILMQQSLKKIHQQKFDDWIEFGSISNQNSYSVQETHIITRQLIKIPAFKYFKIFFTPKNGLMFFCMIKINLKSGSFLNKSALISTQQILTNSAINKPITITDEKVKNHFPNASLSEHIQKNIFIKQDTLQPRAEFQQIQYFKRFSRIFLFIIISSIIILLIITNKNGNSLTSYSNQFINYMNMYRFPIIVATNYMKSFLNVGNATKVANQIKAASNNFLAGSNLQLTKITLFDQLLNPPQHYYPYYNYPFLKNQSYSQIDLFYMVSSSISTLYNKPINQTSPQFQRLNSYLKPSYDNMMNTTKFLLHQQFGEIFDSCITNQFLFTMIQCAIFVIFMVILFTCIHKFILKMRNILNILLDFNQSQINAISTYWKYQRQHFNMLFMQFDEGKGSTRNLSSQNMIKKLSNIQPGNEKISLNKRSKQVNEDRQRKCFQLKLRIIIILVMMAVLAISTSVQVNMIVQLKSLKLFEEAGFFFLKYFPTGPLTTMGCAEKYYADRFPNQIKFNPQKYEDVITTMYIFGNNNYIGEVVDPTSVYYNKQKNYFFGNPCEYNPSILVSVGINVSKCASIANGSFKQGLSSFIRYAQRLGESCIYNKVNLTAAQLDEFTVGGTVLSAYVLDALTTWVSEFASKVVILEDKNAIQSLMVIMGILLIHFLFNQMKIIKMMFSEYEFIKKVYLYLVPESILINEKVVKQKFIIAGLIKP